jgi:hypothetical protein
MSEAKSPSRVVIGIGGFVLSYNSSKREHNASCTELPIPCPHWFPVIRVDESHHVGLIVGTFPHRNAELTGCRSLLTRYYSFLY